MFTVSVGDSDTVKNNCGCMQKGVRSGLSVKLSSIEICDFINILFSGFNIQRLVLVVQEAILLCTSRRK